METLQNLNLPEEEQETETAYGLSDSEIEEIAELLRGDHEEALIGQLSELGPADAAELLSKIGVEDRNRLIREHSAALDPYTFSELPYELQNEVLETMGAAQVASLIAELDSDDALDLIVSLDPEFQQEIIHHLSAKTRLTLEEGLNYPEDSAGRLMQREFVAIPQFWTVGKTIDYMRAAAGKLPEDFFDIFVITPTYKITGVIPLSRLVRARRAEKLENLTLDETYAIPATMDQEDVARLFRREDLISAPVVDSDDRLIGVITVDDIVDVIDEEAQEDIMLLGGVRETDLYASVLDTSARRVRWLVVTLCNTLIASFVISRFEATIEEIVALAILMPIVAAMGGNAGMQVVTVTVRALATRELSPYNFSRIIGKEMGVGLLNGLIFGLIMGTVATLWFGNIMLGAVLMSAMLFNMFWAGIAGTIIPIALTRAEFDPALAAGPFLTTTTDILGFLAFLGLATVFLL